MALLNYLNSPESYQLDEYIYNPKIKEVLRNCNITSLRNIQKEAIDRGLFFNQNFLVSAPSGSGKTLIGELAIINNFFENKDSVHIYLVPYKAIATEKYQQFMKNYSKFCKIELCISDTDIPIERLHKCNILVTTFEKLDSIFRNIDNPNDDFLTRINTIVIDEVHIISESQRGSRLEILIVYILMHFNIQLICLSATIHNPQKFRNWLNSISSSLCSKKFQIIINEDRPVKLKYMIRQMTNKTSGMRSLLKESLEQQGQVLIFSYSRKSTEKNAQEFSKTTNRYVSESDLNEIISKIDDLKKIQGHSPALIELLPKGVGFHHAGLRAEEKKIIEELYNKKCLKLICCTTTLAAGVNMPARRVLLQDFKKEMNRDERRISEDNEDIFENDEGVKFHIYDNNQVFQLLGRAGRPGMDIIGEGIICVSNGDEYEFALNHYFTVQGTELIPKYSELHSEFNTISALRESVLLVIYYFKSITLQELIKFFRFTFFYYLYNKSIKVEKYLLLENLDAESVLTLHATDEKRDRLANFVEAYHLEKKSDDDIIIQVTFNKSLFRIRFSMKEGIICSCSAKFNCEKLSNSSKIKNNYQFCDHVLGGLSKIILNKDESILQYINDIIPESLKSERIIDFLLRQGFITESKEGYCPTPIGMLTVKLYIRPIDMIFLREEITNEDKNIHTPPQVLELCIQYLRQIHSWDENKMKLYLYTLEQWIQERELDQIINDIDNKLYGGDIYMITDEAIRCFQHISSVAAFFDKNIMGDIADTLAIQVKYGIKKELIDLVSRIDEVGRVTGRILYNAGYFSANDVLSSNPSEISQKTKLSLKKSEEIFRNAQQLKFK